MIARQGLDHLSHSTNSVNAIFIFQQGLHYVAQAGLELTIFLPQLPEYWDYRCVPPHLDFIALFYISLLPVNNTESLSIMAH
jgi:hypothetical protein